MKPLSYFHVAQVPSAPRHIVIVSGSHLLLPATSSGSGSGSAASKSCVYIEAGAEFWRRRGWDVTVRTDHGPDDDVVFMARSAHFLRSGGRFGGLVAQFVSANGGRVIPLPQDQLGRGRWE